MKQRHIVWLFVLGVLLALPALGRAQAPPQEPKDIDLIWAVKIPMRDGVKLNGTVYKPKPQAEPLPVVFTFTPYISDTYHERAMYFSRNGYVYVLVDVRGRGNSEGKFEPFANEGRDGHDVVEWLAKQPWSDGMVTMWGGSYAGFDQWTVLKEFPPHLSTIVPVAAAHPGIDFPFQNNIFTSYETQWLTYTSGVTPQVNLFGEQSFWIQKFREMYKAHAAFRELDKIVGNPSPVFQKWLDHPIPDAYYDVMAPNAEQYKRMSVPILSITGHYDGDQPGALEFYKRHMQSGTPTAKENHYLIIGPWDHAGTRTPRREVGGLRFGEASILDMNKLHREWYDWTMKSGKKPEFLKKRVAYYVVGPEAENWKYADTLEAISNEKRTFYLHSQGNANDAFRSGELRTDPPGDLKPDLWAYDPLDTRPGELERQPGQNYLTDQTLALNLFGNGAVYHSGPFGEATEISGYVKLTAWIAMDVPDTDFVATLYEIRPDGTSIQLTQQLQRARYRESLREEKLVKHGEINRYEFDKFTWFSRRISKGSRLRLVIGCVNSIQAEKNYNSGGVVASETGKDARTAHVTLYHDAQHPSALELPIVK
ncbi:MAG: CocE/NonD family hydrolase [Acidobacteria bacterium]|nr:CocE/NonD family hydrolase [Acidobacteriota bacterium]MBI3663760.1 CocE/NonD family hydrolase [Acidobacteriota bacterium]